MLGTLSWLDEPGLDRPAALRQTGDVVAFWLAEGRWVGLGGVVGDSRKMVSMARGLAKLGSERAWVGAALGC